MFQLFSESWRKAIKYLLFYIVLFTVMMNMQFLLVLFRKPQNYNSWVKKLNVTNLLLEKIFQTMSKLNCSVLSCMSMNCQCFHVCPWIVKNFREKKTNESEQWMTSLEKHFQDKKKNILARSLRQSDGMLSLD